MARPVPIDGKAHKPLAIPHEVFEHLAVERRGARAGVDLRRDARKPKLGQADQFTPANDEATHHLLAKPEVPYLPALDLNAPADFDTLVRQGMARLNAQMGLQPIAIENAALKVEALEAIAESIGATNEPHVYNLLRAIAQDLQRLTAK
jgi:hypothetical protein